ncbi:MAG: HD domain-containing phosphohydrolase [Anaerolineales bacterium]
MSEGTVLIVEDNDVLRDGLDEMLSIEGYSTVTAADGREALSKMETVTPDLILADIAMPVMDGFQLFTAVRDRSAWVTIPFIFLTARAETVDIIAGKNLGAEDYLVKPIGREELVTNLRSRIARTSQLKTTQLKEAHLASLTALAKAIELRDTYTGGHVERVMEYALAVGTHLGWNESSLEHLRYGAILHDIGKIHIRESALLKTSSLNNEEQEEMRRHPVIGAEMITDIPYLEGAVQIVRYHHEQWDGKGYPEGLSGKDIPEGARIIAVVDAFDAMTTDRPYSSAISLQEANEELLRWAGEQYDPGVISAFQKAWEKGEIQTISETYIAFP